MQFDYLSVDMSNSIESVTVMLEHDIDQQYQYQPGEILRGTISLVLKRETGIRAIFLTIHGEGSVAWEDKNKGQCYANEVYIDASKSVKDSPDTEILQLPFGCHDFPFEYQLPDHLPSSYIGKYGSVTYVLKVTVLGNKPGMSNIISEPFLVLRNSPLSEKSEQKIEIKDQRILWGLCSFGKVTAEVSVNKSGAVPGEDIYVDTIVANKSPQIVTAIQAAIVMNSKYNAKKSTVSFRQIVNKRRDETEMVKGEGRRWKNVRIPVPPYIPESNLDNCDIIEISYTIHFRVEITGGKHISMEAPITIGSRHFGSENPDDVTSTDSRVNSQWTVGYSGMNGLKNRLYEDELYQDDHDWHGGVPEMRKVDIVTSNPLFDKQPSMLSIPQKKRAMPAEEMEEIIEQTRL